MRGPCALGLALACLLATACAGFAFSTPRAVPGRITSPRRDDARLAVLWVGHATVLVQMDDRFVLTDPLLGNSAGQLSVRLQQPGIDPDALPPLDLVVVSHLHFDHLSLGSLDRIERKVRRLLVPEGGLVYVPNYAFEARELPAWSSIEDRGMRVTAVPVKHVGFRYGVDAAWMTRSFTGYVLEYHGLRVYFPGDTAYDAGAFRAVAAAFPHLDLALLPIAPIRPRDVMKATHMDPAEAVQALLDLGADRMVPIHFDTLVNGLDAPGEARDALAREARIRGVADRVTILPIGGQAVVVPR